MSHRIAQCSCGPLSAIVSWVVLPEGIERMP